MLIQPQYLCLSYVVEAVSLCLVTVCVSWLRQPSPNFMANVTVHDQPCSLPKSSILCHNMEHSAFITVFLVNHIKLPHQLKIVLVHTTAAFSLRNIVTKYRRNPITAGQILNTNFSLLTV